MSAPRPARARRDRETRRVLVSLVLTLLTILALTAAASLAWRHETTSVKIAAGAPEVRLIVPVGANADSIGRDLQVMGLTRHPLVFRLLARSRGVSAQLKAGDYALRGPLSLEDILERLVRGEVVRRALTVPEGRSLEEIARIVADEGMDATAFRKLAHDPAPIRDLDADATDLEGYLFPDTYDVPQTPDATRAMVRRMTQRFRDVITPELPRIREQGLTVRQAVTLASLVELETARPEERPLIAAVFRNRLARGMLLQTDPTIIYALKKAGRWDGNIRRADLAIDSPYNTYAKPGLPPGPIGCPGREAIRAVLEPAPTKALYFVSRNDGTHVFSESLEAHNRAVDRYQRRRSAS